MPARFPTSRCAGCNAPIVWGVDWHGKKHPLDPKPPTFRVEDIGGDHVLVSRDEDVLVSHFATCKEAKRFSGRNRGVFRPPPPPPPPPDPPGRRI